MDFAFSEEQEFLRSTARDFFAKECPMNRVRELMEEAAGHDPALWQKMAELGWVGLLIPEEYGGAGLGMVDLVPLLEELGRGLVPTPCFANWARSPCCARRARSRSGSGCRPSPRASAS
jgi:alkylation response protein AidB-like acyl-CoA dehydrogenase